MMSSSSWSPLFRDTDDGSSQEPRPATISAIVAIAEALEVPRDDLGDSRPPSQSVDLVDGSAGVALLFAYLSLASRRVPELGDPERWAEAASAQLDHAIEGAGSLPLSPELAAGLTGVAWSMAHVAAVLGFEAEIPESLDAGLVGLVASRPWRGDLDLVSGLVGLGVYFLERLPHPLAERGLLEIVERLSERAHRDADGIAWHTPARVLPEPKRQQFPAGYFDLGVAHGLAGVISFLAGAHAAGVAPHASRELLEGAVAWLLARRRETTHENGLPWAHVPGLAPRPARSAWCYGDPGIGVVLLRAGGGCGREDWAAQGHELVRAAAKRAPSITGVVDAGLCHGSAGLLHMLHRAQRAAPDPEIRQAMDAWLRWTLTDPVRGGPEPVPGLRARVHRRGEPAWVEERGLLNGAAGVGLALLATVSDVAPAWDRVLLLSGREQAPAVEEVER